MEKKGILLSLVALLSLSGCLKKDEKTKKTRKTAQNKVDIPLADDSIRSFFDDDLGEFALVEDDATFQEDELIDQVANASTTDEFAWVKDDQKEDTKVVYFDFDRDIIREDQQASVEYDIERVKEVLKNASKDGQLPTVVIEGHACHSAGSSVYNLALSEKRAKIVSDWFASAGIPRENIKIVGRGSEMPAVGADGKEVTGDRKAQWANRRAEVRIIYS